MNTTPHPCIGIFWILPDNTIFAFPEPLILEAKGHHFHDSADQHKNLWKKVVLRHKEFGDFGYEEIPRGRIIYDYQAKKFLAYVCDDFVKKPDIRAALREAFCLSNNKVAWKTDEHYNFGTDEIDPADIDD